MKDNQVYLRDILESISAIEDYVKDLSEGDFFTDQEKQDAVIRRLEIIGEATKNLDEDFKNKHSDIPWRKMAGMRDVLIHEYFGVNVSRVWQVIKDSLPSLKDNLIKIIDP